MAQDVKMPNRKKNILMAIIVVILAIAAIGGTVAFIATRGTASAVEVNETEAPSSISGEQPSQNGDGNLQGGENGDNPIIPGNNNVEMGNNNVAGNQNAKHNNTRREEELKEVEIIDYETTIVERGTDGRYLSWDINGVKSGIGYASKINVKPNPSGINVNKVGETSTGKNLATAGDEITYTITVTSDKVVTNCIEVMDRIPEKTTYIPNSVDNYGALLDKDGKETTSDVAAIRWEINLTKLNAETGKYEQKLSFKVKVNDNATGTIRNTAIANGEENEIPAENAIVTSLKTSELYRNNKKIEEPAKIGDKIVYTINVTNTGDIEGEAILKDASIRELVDKGILVIDDEIVNKLSDGIKVTVPANGEGKYQFEAIIKKVDGEIKNVASIGSENPENTIDTVNITAEKKASATEVSVGDTISYTIKLSNSGSKAGEIIVRDNAPDGTEFISAKLDNNNISENELSNGYKVTVPADGEKEIVLTVKVVRLKKDGTATDTVKNTAFIKGEDSDEEEPISSDDTKVANITAIKTSDYEGKLEQKALYENAEITYKFDIENKGTANGKITISDDAPRGTAFVENSIKVNEEDTQYTLENLKTGIEIPVAAGARATLTFKVKVLTFNGNNGDTITIKNDKAKIVKDNGEDDEPINPTEDTANKVKASLTITKTWQEPETLGTTFRPTVTIAIYNGNTQIGESKNLTSDSVTFDGLNKFAEDGSLIAYTIKETMTANGATSYYNNTTGEPTVRLENETNTVNITNRFDVTKLKDVNITVTKVWDDADNDSNTRELVTFMLSNNAGNSNTEKTVANTNSGTTVTFDGMQRYKDTGTTFELVQYTVAEKAFNNDKYYTTEITYPDGKTYVEGTGEVTVTNTLIFDHDDFMHDTVTITKAWNDKNNDNGTRGEGAELTLYKALEDGTETQVGETKTTMDNGDISFTDLPRYENKKPISYIVKETNYPTNYAPSYAKTGDGADKTYALNGETITNNINWSGFLTEDDDLVATKIWVDNISEVNRRPNEVTLTVVSNNAEIQANTDITLAPDEGSSNTWKINVEGLRIYDDEGNVLTDTYTLVENDVPNLYGKAENGMTVTNTAKYIITSSVVGGNGTITPEGETIVVYDGEQTYTFAPKQATADEPGYTIKSLEVDGVEQTRYNEPRTDLLTNGYTFSNVKKDYTIVVTYGLDENKNDIPDDEEPHYTIEFIAGNNGRLSGDTLFTNILINMPFYDMVTVPTVAAGTVIPDAGYHFDNEWTPTLPSENSLVTEDAEYTAIFRPDTDITYTVKYQKEDGTKLHDDKPVTGQTMATTVTEDAIPIAGYTPRETQKSLKLQATNNEIIFIYDANTNAAFTTKHYVEKIPGAEFNETNGDIRVGTKAYELFETPTVTTATVDTTRSDDSNILDGFTLDPVTTVNYAGNAGLTYDKDEEGNPVLNSEGKLELSGVVKQEFDAENNLVNTLVFNFFYSRNKYTVNYIIVGDKPTSLKEETVPARETEPTHYYGETITIAPNAEIEGTGYTFSGWKSTLGLFQDGEASFTMPDRDVVLQGRFTPTNDSAEYFMLSYREVISKDLTKPETTTLGSKTFDTYKEIGGKIYELDPEAHALTGKPHAEAKMDSAANGTQYVINLDVTKSDSYNTATRTYDHVEIVEGEEQVTHLVLQNLFKVTRNGETVEDVIATDLQDGDIINSIKGTILAAQDKELVLVLYYDLVPHTVSYEYRDIPTGYTLEDLPELPGPSTHRYTEVVAVAAKPSLPGYNFDRWYLVSPSLWVGGASGAHEQFNMPDRDVLVYGRFTAKTDAKYTVKHYVEKLAGAPAKADDIVGSDGKTYELHDTELVPNVTVDTTVKDHSKEAEEIAGFTLDVSATVNYSGNAGLSYDKDEEENPVLDSQGRLELSGIVKQDAEGNNLLVFNFFYSRNKYDVSYILNGYEPTNLTDASKAILNSEPVEYYYEQTVTVEDDLETEGPGYTFSHWYSTLGLEITDNANGTRTFTMPHRDVVLHGRFTIDHEHKVDYNVVVYKEVLKSEYDANHASDDNYSFKTDTVDGVEITTYYKKTTTEHHAEAQEVVTEQFHNNAYVGYHINVDRTRNAEENTRQHLVEYLDDDGKVIDELTTYVSNDVSHINGTDTDYITGEVFADGTTELAAYYDLNVYNVVYQYEGTTPTGTPTKPETESHKYGEEIAISTQDQTVLGYTFSGWHADNSASHPVTITDGKFIMPDRNVTIKGNYEANTVNYYSYHFVEKLVEDTTNYAENDVITINGKTYVKRNEFTRTSTGKVDSPSRVTESLVPSGFTINVTDTVAYIVAYNSNPANVGKEITYTTTDTKVTQQGIITVDSEGNGDRAFIYLYNRNKYSLQYYIAGDHVPTNVTGVPGLSEHYFEETITVAEPASAEGYVFTGWRKAPTQSDVNIVNGQFTMPAGPVKIYGTFNTSNQQVEYNITIYKETLTPDANSVRVEDDEGNVTWYNKETVTPPHKANVYALVEEPFHDNAYVGYHINVDRTKAAAENNVQHEETTTTEEGVTTTIYVTNDVSNINGTNNDSIKSRVYADGTTSFAAYYDLNSYSVTYSYTGNVRPDGMPDVPKDTVLHKYGEEVAVSTQDQTVTGYTFSGWHAESGATNPVTITNGKFEMPARNVKLEGSYSANTDTPYQVKHWQQNIDDDEYTLVLTEPKTGTTNTSTNAIAKTYTGFTAKAFSQSTIAPDGSTVVNIYYDRHVWNVTYRYSGTAPTSASEIPAQASYRYGATVDLAPDATAETGYTFSGWSSSSVTINNRQFTMPDDNVTISGSWIGGLRVTTTASYPTSDKKPAAEVGDEITYTFEATEIGNVNYPRTIQIKLESLQRPNSETGEAETVSNPFINIVEGNGISYDPDTGIVTWTITSGTASNLKTTLKVTVNNTFYPGSTITATVIEGAIGDPNTVNVETTVQVMGITNKNIVLALDVSGSMNFCAEHGTNYLLTKDNWGNVEKYGSSYAGNIYACVDCGREHLSGDGETASCTAKDSNGVEHGTRYITYHRVTSGFGMWATNTDTYYCSECANNYASRIKALKSAATAFVNSINTNKGSETVKVKLLPFASNADSTSYSVVTLSDSTIGTLRTNISNMSANGGTNIREAVTSATTILNSLASTDNDATNILVFLSDGNPDNGADVSGNSNGAKNAIKNLYLVNNIQAFAVGLGNGYSEAELKAIVKNDTSRIFTAENEQQLVAKFEEIANTINSMQTEVGYLGDTLKDVENIYPVVLSYKPYGSSTVTTITCNNYADLQANHVTIDYSAKKITWDVDNEDYHGMTNFVIKLGSGAATRGTRAASTMNTKSMSKGVSDSGDIVDFNEVQKILTKGATEISDAPASVLENMNYRETETQNVVETTENVVETTEETNSITESEISNTNVLSAIIEQVENGKLNEETVNAIEDKEETFDENTKQENYIVEEAETQDKIEENNYVETKIIESEENVAEIEDTPKAQETETKIEIEEPFIDESADSEELVTINTIAE